MKHRYTVWCPELSQEPEDGKQFMAHDHEDAAKQWGRWSDCSSSDYTIANGTPTEVLVAREDGSDKPGKFMVRAEPSIDYYAKEIK
jgi:hypothetical protein